MGLRTPVAGEQMILSEARNRLVYLLHQFEKRGSPAIVAGQTHRTIRALDKLRFFLDREMRRQGGDHAQGGDYA